MTGERNPPDGWVGPPDRIELTAPREQRHPETLYEWFGSKSAVGSEQDAWLFLRDEYEAQLEASGMPPAIADRIRTLLSDHGQLVILDADDAFLLLAPASDVAYRFGQKSQGEHRVMDISQLDGDELTEVLGEVDREALVDAIVALVSEREDLDGARGLVEVWHRLHERLGLDLATVFEVALEREVVSERELYGAVRAATRR